MRYGWLVLALGALAGGCARGPLPMECPQFAALSHALPPSPLEREIHGDTETQEAQSTRLTPDTTAVSAQSLQGARIARTTLALRTADTDEAAPETLSDDITQRLLRARGALPRAALSLRRERLAESAGETARAATDDTADTGTGREEAAVLLLSGGGQWGAFGAGYLDSLRKRGAMPDLALVTGVSTGALQSLFVGVGTEDAYRLMLAAYAPTRESEIVDRNPEWETLFTGSMAGLEPLRRRIEQALCPDDALNDTARSCHLDALRALDGRRSILLGFVDAETGGFRYVDAVEAAQLPRTEARACIVSAALASAAMPVFFQPVQVNGRTYYDGGVRASVFEASIAASAEAAAEMEQSLSPEPAPDGASAAAQRAPVIPLYVVRNGPTTVPEDADINDNHGPLSAAMRAEAIVVNQLEVGSIAALRLEHPSGPLNLVTADGWDGPDVACVKPPSVMFSPEFMACLTRFGRTRAQGATPWTRLSPIIVREENVHEEGVREEEMPGGQ